MRASARLAIALAITSSGLTGCQGDDSAASADAGSPGATDGSVSNAPPAEAGPPDAATATSGGAHASASFSASSIDLGAIGCGGAPGTATLAVSNVGGAALTLTATTTGAAFSVTPTTLTVPAGASGSLTVAASVPGSSTAAIALTGSLDLFSNDPAHASVSVPLSATPTGATLAFAPGSPATLAFPSTEVGTPAPAIAFTLTNVGNAAAIFSLSPPSDARFTVITPAAKVDAAADVDLVAGASWTASADYTPTNTLATSGTAAITVTGPTCGASLSAVSLSGQGTVGQIAGWPTASIDFGPSACGGAAPATQSFTLLNTGAVDAHITQVALSGAPGFTSSAAVGRAILANGGVLAITVSAPPVPSPSPMAPLTATLTVQTDADAAPHGIPLTVEPSGAVLAFDTSGTASFGSFGPVVLLQSASQGFAVANTGNAAATVTLVTGASSPFSVSSPTFSIPANGSQAETATFAPLAANGVSGSLGMTVTGPLCSALPASLPLSGIGIGGGPSVVPSALSFPAPCGGAAPAPQSLTIQNDGTVDLTWSMGAITGPGATQYTATASPSPGLLQPGEGATITVTAAAIPSPAPNADPSALAAAVTITTDVPLDPPHVVALGETPLGDQLSFSTQSLRFGQFPIDTTIAQTLTVVNDANVGSPAANLSLAVQGSGASGYSVATPTVTNLAPGGSSPAVESITFAPTAAVSYPATLAIVTSDSVCTPLPAPVQLTGTGTDGKVFVSTTSLAFGTDATDPAGLVDCGATGLSHDLTVSNIGNQVLQITGLALGLGPSSPYTLSGTGASLPATVPIGGDVTITVTPKAIPATVANPNDPSPFTDTLTLTTNAALDSPHVIPLRMQARGAVISDTPLTAAWNFGTIGFGSIGTFTSTIQNTGNAPLAITLDGAAQPSIFGIRNNPTTAASSGVASVVGQFTPPSADGAWSDRGSLVLSGPLCAPLPAQWSNPTITMSGFSSNSPAVTLSGTLSFPTTSCGNASPSGRTVTLTNNTNVAYSYQARLNSGSFHSIVNPGPGTLQPGGSASIEVAPVSVTPGPGVRPGSAPYADDLLVSVATSPPTTFTVPISWALSGAVLSLPQGAGPSTDGSGNAFYPADSTSGFALPMSNTGTAAAMVTFAVAPAAAFTFSPTGAVHVLPGIPATPELVSSSSAPACPATSSGTVSFIYAGPVCQPLALSSVTVHYCAGTL